MTTPWSKRGRIRSVLLATIIIGIAFISSISTSAQQSQLSQQISEPDCSRENGCETRSPTIEEILKNGGRPIITGTYDAAYTESLRAIFGGVTYTLDSGDFLTAANDEWRLSLDALASPLTPGEYELSIEAIGYNDKILRARATIEILQSDVPDESLPPESPGEEVPKPNGSDNGKAEESFVPLLLLFVPVIGSLIFYLSLRKKPS